MIRKQCVEIQIRDNPFVKCSPTTKIYNLIEQNQNMIKIRVFSKAKEVPYCDCFMIEEEMICVMPQNCNNSSVFRVTMKVIWVKSTIMKSIV